ncbi:unnamed protein product [Somion occarium]|uniref:F-box domain-containing protein n=1 Tax=Somion occarium TaxID=3059160 RepID=A0ABP1D4C0_9APHY
MDDDRISHVPIELLIQIFCALTYKEILTCRLACKFFDTVIRNDARLQYKIQLGLNGQQDGPSTNCLNVHDRLLILNEYQAAWDQLRFDPMMIVDMESDRIWEIRGNVLSQASEESLVFVQLPSRVRNIDERRWSLNRVHIPLRDYAFDPAQDLLILVESHGDVQDYEHHIHLRTLSTGDAHPSATITKIVCSRLVYPISYEIRISSEYLAVGFYTGAMNPDNLLCIWNWKTGERQMELPGAILAYAFLTKHHIILIRKQADAELLILDLRSISPCLESPVDEVECICTFRFPTLKQDKSIDYADIRSEPTFDWSPDPALAVPFHVSSEQRLFVVTMRTQDFESSITFLIPRDTLLRHFHDVPDLPPKHRVEWNEWGPKGARAMRTPSGHSSSWLRNVYGMRFVFMEEGDNSSVLVADFNQAAFRKALFNEETMSASSYSSEHPQRMKLMIEATTLDGSWSMFVNPVITSLPFRYANVPLPPDDEIGYEAAMVSEDSIIVVDFDMTEKTRYYVLSI